MSDAGGDQHGSPPRPRTYRISTLRDFLPLSEESVLSTRGQNLPALIQSRSSTSLANVRSPWNRRRRSSAGAEDVPPRRSQENERDRLPDLERRCSTIDRHGESDDRRLSTAANVLMTPQIRSQRLIGNSNPRYRWEQYWKTDEQLGKMPKKLRKYYERCNYLVQRYLYIDRLLDSSLPRNLIEEYQHPGGNAAAGRPFDPSDVPATITEEASTPGTETPGADGNAPNGSAKGTLAKVKRTPKDIYRLKPDDTADGKPDEQTPLLTRTNSRGDEEAQLLPPDLEEEEETDASSRIVTIAIIINTVANVILLGLKLVVAVLTNSISVLASLADAILDFLSTAVIGTTTFMIARTDTYKYPIGRRRLEPVGVMVFAVVMITVFAQVAIKGIQRLIGSDHEVVQLSTSAIIIMAVTVGVKGLCWLWCKTIRNSSVQALAQDAQTDVVFNTFSIVFPLIGYYANLWWLDPLGGVLLSFYVIATWSLTCLSHVKKLTGCAASADERNVLLYLTMRFAKTIKQIQGLQAYHQGDKVTVECDVVVDEGMTLRDSHDLGESLQYVLESVPIVDRAFVHLDYASYNLPSHMQQDS